jgi:hypothetical protein
VGLAGIRSSWATLGVGLGLAFCLSGCQQLFPRPAYAPPAPTAPAPAPAPRPQIARPTFYVAVKDRLNLRACPGMDCPKIAVLKRNEEVESVGSAGDWSQIRVKRNGTIGWVYSRYLSPTPLPALPPEMAPAPTPAPQVTPPPLPEVPEKVKPTPAKPPAVEKPPAKPAEGVTPAIKRKPEEVKPAKPAKPAPPEEEVAPTPVKRVKPEKPAKVEKPEKPAKPAPAPLETPTPPAEPTPEKPSSIRIM